MVFILHRKRTVESLIPKLQAFASYGYSFMASSEWYIFFTCFYPTVKLQLSLFFIDILLKKKKEVIFISVGLRTIARNCQAITVEMKFI